MKILGAVFGQKFGWERPNFFATDGMEQRDDWSFRRSKWFEAIKKECQNVKENVGLLDMTAFAKCRIKGPGAEDFLDYLVANNLPKKIGRIGLCHALNTKGGVHAEAGFADRSRSRGLGYVYKRQLYLKFIILMKKEGRLEN